MKNTMNTDRRRFLGRTTLPYQSQRLDNGPVGPKSG